MAKYHGMIGYAVAVDRGNGIFEEEMTEHPAFGDLTRWSKHDEAGSSVNDDIRLQNDISIIMDPFSTQNYSRIRYATFMGERWKVSSVTVERPRLTLSMGGVYNGPTPDISEEVGGDSGSEEGLLPAPGDGEDGLSGDSV